MALQQIYNQKIYLYGLIKTTLIQIHVILDLVKYQKVGNILDSLTLISEQSSNFQF